jgi:hypothetical protein
VPDDGNRSRAIGKRKLAEAVRLYRLLSMFV